MQKTPQWMVNPILIFVVLLIVTTLGCSDSNDQGSSTTTVVQNTDGTTDDGGTTGITPNTDLCGNNEIDQGEACDHGENNDDLAYGGCNSDCQYAARCGDGNVDTDFEEECDEESDNCTQCRWVPTAYRIIAAQLLDPHVFINTCQDDVQNFINQSIQSSIDEGLNNLFVFRPLQQTAGIAGNLDYVSNAKCEADGQFYDCSIKGEEVETVAMRYLNKNETCLEPSGFNELYQILGPIVPMDSPCFVTEATNISTILDLGLPLSQTKISGNFKDNPAVAVLGLIQGYLDKNTIEGITVNINGDQLPVSDLLCNPDDLDNLGDTEGWWVYMRYEAVKATLDVLE